MKWLLPILCLLVCALVSGCVATDQKGSQINGTSDSGSASHYVVGQNLTDKQVSDIISIVNANKNVETEIDGIAGTHINLNVPGSNYHLINVSVMGYDDADAGIVGVLPAVSYFIGPENSGVTVISFVDPDRGRVVYVRESRWFTPDTQFNMYIVDTGFEPDTNLTDEQQSEIIGFALDNATVKEMLSKQNYTNAYAGMVTTVEIKGKTNICTNAPEATFMVINNTGPSYRISAAVDMKTKNVTWVSTMGLLRWPGM